MVRIVSAFLLMLFVTSCVYAKDDEVEPGKLPGVVSPPGIDVCDGSGTGNNATIPAGIFYNPARAGSGWHVESVATNLPGSSTPREEFNFYWLTFDSSNRPTWYRVGPVSVSSANNLGTIQAPIHRYQRSSFLPPVVEVGRFAATLIPDQPNKIAISWALDSPAVGAQVECIRDFFRSPAVQARNAQTASPSIYQGLWRFSNISPLEGVLVTNFPQNGEYVEVVNPLTYDSEGNAVWLQGVKRLPLNIATYSATQTYSGSDLKYLLSRFPGGIPTSNCQSPPCYVELTAQAGQTLTLTRQFGAGATGSFVANATFTDPQGGPAQQIQESSSGTWNRDPISSYVTPQTFFCGIPAGSTTCSVPFDWGFPNRPPGPAWNVRFVLERVESSGNTQVSSTSIAGVAGTETLSLSVVSGNATTYRAKVTYENSAAGEPLKVAALSLPVVVTGTPSSTAIGTPLPGTCNMPASGITTPLAAPLVPGLYANSQRPQTAWSINFDEVAGQVAIVAEWYSFDSLSRPVWRTLGAAQFTTQGDGTKIANGPLIERRLNMATLAMETVVVGAATFVVRPNDPRRAAVRWLLIGSPHRDECLTNSFEPQTNPVVSPALIGTWEPNGYPQATYTENYGAPAGGQRFTRWLDTQGNPVWLRSVVSSLSEPPMNGSSLSESLYYVPSPYTGGIPLNNCVGAACTALGEAQGTLMRSYSGPSAGTARISVNAFNGTNQTFAAISLPASGSLDTAKRTNVDSVHIDRTHCDLNQGSCQVLVRWDSRHGEARLFQRNGEATPIQIGTTSQGALTLPISTAGTYQYTLHRAASATTPMLAVSALLTVTGSTAEPAPHAVAMGGLAYRLSWQAGPGTVDVGFTNAASTPPSSAAATGLAGTQYDGTVPVAGTYYFFIRRCAPTCGAWSPASNPLTLANTAPAAEIADDPRGVGYNPTLHDYQSPYQPNVPSILAGAIPGQAATNGGSASYTLPIAIPPGRRGMQPTVALSYSSRAGNGIAGMGFSLSVGGAITRCPSTLATDGVIRAVKFDGSDRLCLDGQRLILEPDQLPTVYGTKGARYRTEIDSYARIIQHDTQSSGDLGSDGTVYFEVLSRDGMRRYYGADQAGANSRNARVKPGGAPGARTLSWLLNTELDRAGNHIQYNYDIAGSGENLLSRINYTGQDANVGTRSVQFVYENRTDRSSSHLAGALSEQTKRLTRVLTAIGTQLVAEYDLVYQLSNATRRSLLSEVHQCNWQAASANPTACIHRLDPNRFTWQDTPGTTPNLVATPITWPSALQPVATPGQPVLAAMTPLADIDGDGVVEMRRQISSASGQVRSFLVSFDASRQVRGWIERTIAGTPTDLNNDGRADFWNVDGQGSMTIGSFRPRAGCVGTECSEFVDANFVTQTLSGFCSLLRPLESSSSAFNVQFHDFNGDSLPDLQIESSSACSNGRGIYLYVNQSAPQSNNPNHIAFATSPLFIPLASTGSPGGDERLIAVQDLEGDGMPEIITEQNLPAPTNQVKRIGFANGTPTTVTTESLSSLLDGSTFLMPATARRSYFTDINGDGLDDMVLATPYQTNVGGASCDSRWTLRINRGGRFTDVIEPTEQTPGARRAALELYSLDATSCQPVARLWEPEHAGLVSPIDLDADGRSELIVPSALAERNCTDVYVGSSPTKAAPAKVCAPHPRQITPASGALVSLGDVLPNNVFSPPAPPAQLPDPVWDLSLLDSSTYRMSRLVFRQSTSGWTVSEESLPPAYERQIRGQQDIDRMDFFGDGLADVLLSRGCKIQWVGQSQSACSLESGANVALSSGPTLFANNGAGISAGMSALAPEMLTGVSDSFGPVASWTYQALSSRANRSASELPLYRVPARAAGVGYIDANHFYFASSMNVVSEMKQRNGVSGMNTTRYGYEEAMYHNKGRGFVGFRKIVTEDLDSVAAANERLRSATIFHQKFPLVSQPECSVTQLASDSLSELRCDTQQAITLAKSNLYECNGVGCTTAQNQVGLNTAFRVIARQQVSETRELNLRSLLVTRRTQSVGAVGVGYDVYGNVLQQTTETQDFISGDPNPVRTHTVTVNNSYDSDAASWWVNKLVRSTTTTTQSYGGAWSVDAPAVPPRTTTTLLGYGTASNATNLRLPACETLIGGSPAGSASCESVSGFEQRFTRSFDSYGNTSVETQAAPQAASRTTSTCYETGPTCPTGSEGYFPTMLTDPLGRSTSTVFDARFGTPTQVTSPNNLTTITIYDPLGRVVREVVPFDDGLRTAMPVVTSYERCGGGIACSEHAVIRVVRSQYGSPQSMQYLDTLGRVVQRSSKLIGATYAINAIGLTDAEASVNKTDYDASGRIFAQWEPDRNAPSGTVVTFMYYDAVSRPFAKVEQVQDVSRPFVALGFYHHRRTWYSHVGHVDTVLVCQDHGAWPIPGCAPNGTNPDGSPVLNMARTYDSAQKLVSSQDANGKTTYYWHDGAGNPLKLKDVTGKAITSIYDNFGRRLSVTDPSSGTTSFTYNGFGEMLTRTDARLRTGTFSYDALGRVTQRSWDEFPHGSTSSLPATDVTNYDNTSATLYGTIASVTRTVGTPTDAGYEHWQRSFAYDRLARATETTTAMQVGPTGTGSSRSFTTRTFYDRNFGRPKQMVYPPSVADSNGAPVSTYIAYNAIGIAVREGFVADYNPVSPEASPAIRELVAVNGRGQPIAESLGVAAGGTVDWRVSSIYDGSGWLLAQCVNGSGVCSADVPSSPTSQPLDQRYRYDVYGNLKTQWHNGQWLQGTNTVNGAQGRHDYAYDSLHRLTQHTRIGNGTGTQVVNLSYDDIGNLTRKTDYSSTDANPDPVCLAGAGHAYCYQPNSHRLKSVTLVGGGTASFLHDNNGNITERAEPSGTTNISYDIDNLARRMTRGLNRSDFYEAPGGRYLQRLVNGSTMRDTWMLDKSYEQETIGGSVSIERYYIAGHLLTIKPDAQADQRRKLSYLHRDRLGSPVSITEKPLPANGTLGTASVSFVEHRGFDPFGKAYDGQWGTSNNGNLNLGGALFNVQKRNQRGFTEHEHLDEYRLIHMNGRLYDHDLGRFLGVDPFIQFPSNSQSLNPYAYLMNNPMSGTDPTGYKVECRTDDDCSITDVESYTVMRNTESGERYLVAQDAEGNTIEVTSFKINGAETAVDANLLANVEMSAHVINTAASRSDKDVLGTRNWFGDAQRTKRQHFDNYQQRTVEGVTTIAVGFYCTRSPTTCLTMGGLAYSGGGIDSVAAQLFAGGLLGRFFSTADSLAPAARTPMRRDEIALAFGDPLVRVTEKGLARVERHLAQFGDEANAAMLQRLRSGHTTEQDINFYLHELKESSLMGRGLDARSAHEATLNWQGIPYEPGYEAQLYAKDVIQQFRESFSPAARKAAGVD